ncbi:phage tail tape measure protein [Aliivibrio salmonicida]|uniref:phage tail tape measure protein n=1 Tax=Aliivibrio salmonicida TaxID=40269 RepID=UPI00406CAFAF
MSEQKHKLTLVMAMADKFTEPFAKVTTMTQKGATTIERTQTKLKALQQASGKVDSFRKLQASTEKTSEALEKARLKAQMMTRELSGMTNPTKKQTAAIEKQWQEVNRLEKAQSAEVRQLNHLRGDLYKVGLSTRDLDSATRQISNETQRYTQRLNAEQLSLQRVANIQNKVNKLTQRNNQLMSSAVTDSAKATAAGLAIKGMVTTYGDLASAQGELQSLGVGAEGIDKITKAARDFSQQWSGTTQEQFITASYEIKSGISSLSDTAVGEFTKIAALTAGATKSTTDQMTDLFASGYNIYRKQFDQFGAETTSGWQAMSATERDARFGEYFSAGISTSVQAFKTNGQEMASAISGLGAAATSANVPFSEQLAILGQLQSTMSGGEAATKYAAFLGSAAGAGEKLGLNFLDANDQLKSLPDILAQLRQSYGDTLDAMEKQELKKAFGTDEAIDMIDLMYPKLDQLESNITNMNQSLKGGLSTTMKMANDILNGPNESLKLFEQPFFGSRNCTW